MHPGAYGLTNTQRERMVDMAKENLYYEAYISDQFGVSIAAVRHICAEMGGYVCKWLDDDLKHHDGREI